MSKSTEIHINDLMIPEDTFYDVQAYELMESFGQIYPFIYDDINNEIHYTDLEKAAALRQVFKDYKITNRFVKIVNLSEMR